MCSSDLAALRANPEKKTRMPFMPLFAPPSWSNIKPVGINLFCQSRPHSGRHGEQDNFRGFVMGDSNINSFLNQPDESGRFGIHGGRFVAETLMPLILDVEKAYKQARTDKAFQRDMAYYQTHYIGRPSPLYFAERLTAHFGGAKLYLKRDELNHTGAHKINNVLGQALLAKRMGKRKIIAETGAGQHGVATATACALFDMECEVFMGAEDVERQKPNVDRMRLLGAKIHPVTAGTGTLKDAMNEALRYWVTNAETHFYIIGTVAGPHPYPQMVRDFQSVKIGRAHV